jgi:16S rRNA (cytidine1402-2'-O)-methyltransferase
MPDGGSFGRLYLIPVPLGESDIEADLPPAVVKIVRGLRHFVVEQPKTARQILKRVGTDVPLQSLVMEVLDEHTAQDQLPTLLAPLLQGEDVGLMSEAGCPAIADPGAPLVALAHRQGIRVCPLVGPSSILLALMSSGLEGQRFAFHGYLPTDKEGRLKCIAELERESLRRHQTQIFIETPYRNNATLAALLTTLQSSTRVCVALDLTLANEIIRTLTVAQWRKLKLDVHRRPAVFLFLAGPSGS